MKPLRIISGKSIRWFSPATLPFSSPTNMLQGTGYGLATWINSSVCWGFFWKRYKSLRYNPLLIWKNWKMSERISNQFVSAWSWWFTTTFGYFDERDGTDPTVSTWRMCQKKTEQAQPTTNLNHPVAQWLTNFLLQVIPKRSKIVMFYLRNVDNHWKAWFEIHLEKRIWWHKSRNKLKYHTC